MSVLLFTLFLAVAKKQHILGFDLPSLIGYG